MERDPAGFWIRFAALLLDGLAIGLFASLIVNALKFHDEPENLQKGIEFLYFLLVPVFWSGYTIGKRLLNIRIVKIDGKSPHIGTMFMRTFVAAVVYAFTAGIGFIISAFMVAFREDRRAIHDFVARTYVQQVRK